uniref:Uncharacterized protein n=1 Tax=Arundo donax TaxID=35708 RepID=A0A0A9C618_ARUDO
MPTPPHCLPKCLAIFITLHLKIASMISTISKPCI